MIVVNLNKSYPQLVRSQDNVPQFRLQGITEGDWPKLNQETLEGFDDVLVGTYDGMIVSAYRITGTEPVDYDGIEKIRFQVGEAIAPNGDRFGDLTYGRELDPWAWLIGCPIPGGDWKRGENRGTRRYSLETYLEDHPELKPRQEGDFSHDAAVELLQHFRGDRLVVTTDFPQLNSDQIAQAPAPVTGVTVVRQPGGTVVITIPTGTRAQVNIEPDAA